MIARFSLLRQFKRPAFYIYHNAERYLAMLDTGALFSVFADTAERMEQMGGKLIENNVSFSGFGGKCSGTLFLFDISIGAITYRSMPVICAPLSDTRFSFILSAGMFTGFKYTIDDRMKILTVDTCSNEREFRLRGMGGSEHVHVLINES